MRARLRGPRRGHDRAVDGGRAGSFAGRVQIEARPDDLAASGDLGAPAVRAGEGFDHVQAVRAAVGLPAAPRAAGVLYNSIYRADDKLLVNQHAYGIPAAHSPVFCLSSTGSGEMATLYMDSFKRVWASAVPLA
jgi:hypothetical protein